MADPDCAVRYWGVMGALIRGADEVHATRASPHVRIAAAEALGRVNKEQTKLVTWLEKTL